MKTDLFQSCGHCWVFQICWHIECSTIESSFRIWNSSTGIPSPPLALFIMMLPKTLLTSQSRISGSRWVITPSWLSRSLISFFYSSSVYSCHLFLISSVSVRSLPFLSFIVSIFAWNVPLVPNFLKSSLVFPILLFSSVSWYCSFLKAFLPLCSSSELCIQLGISFPFSFAFCFSFSQLFVSPQTTTCLLAFLFLGDGSGYHLLYSVTNLHPFVQDRVLEALCLPDLVPSIYLSLHCIIIRGLIKSYLNGLVVFPTFFNLSLNLAIKSSWSAPQSTSGLVFANCIDFLHPWQQRIWLIWFQCWPFVDILV